METVAKHSVWHRRVDPAVRALEQSERELLKAQAQLAEARQIAADLRRVEQRNHLVDSIKRTFIGGTA